MSDSEIEARVDLQLLPKFTSQEKRMIVTALRAAREHLITGGEFWKLNFDLCNKVANYEPIG